MKARKEPLSILIQPQGRGRMAIALSVLFAGVLLLLLSVLAWTDITQLSHNARDNGASSSYIVAGKAITERSMAADNTFTTAELSNLLHAPQVQDGGAVVAAQFPVYATIGGNSLSLATDLPVASVPDRLIDNIPDRWHWEPGQRALPVIMSSEFLRIYNYVFAPGQGLPQLSRESVKAIALTLHVGGPEGIKVTAYVAGFTDRVNTLLVPESFVQWGNSRWGSNGGPSQVLLQVKDPSDAGFSDYLQEHGYVTDARMLQWSRLRTIAGIVTSVTGLLALMLMAISGIVFTLYTELTVARAHASIALLGQLGYSNATLRAMLLRRVLPPVLLVITGAALCGTGVQMLAASRLASDGLILSIIPQWPYWLVYGGCATLLYVLLRRSVARATA